MDSASSQDAKFRKEYIAMGAILVIVLAVGGVYVFNANKKIKHVRDEQIIRKVNHNEKRYDEGQLHFVHESLLKYDQVHRFPTEFKEASSIHSDEKGGLIVAGDSGIKIFDEKGALKQKIATSDPVSFVTQDAEGRIYACIKDRIEIFDAKGNASGSIKNERWKQGIYAIAINKKSLYVAVGHSMKEALIWKSDLEGKVTINMGQEDKINSLTTPFQSLDMDVGSDGLLYVTNPGRHQINLYSEEGKLEGVFGRPSFKHEGFCGCCNPVAMTILDDGQVVTSEKGIARVKLMSIKGELQGIVAPPVDFKENKHAYIIDLSANQKGAIFLLEKGTNEVYIYQKREA